MKKLPNKSDIRAEIEASVEDFIAHGGAVNEVPRGQSAWQPGQGRHPSQYTDKPRQTQTFVPEIIAAIEARRKPQAAVKDEKPRKPQKRLVLDDFGEPLRWEWVE